ncbi:MAG: hypothetical protein ACR2O1_02895 [Boseongicola sp.]
MTGSNKILTVSYGTFSCTLEGFDDPFGTMRGIAEYFRDLASDDRYFGAEPPTPDVEMLQKIAQKEVQRKVEARVGETGVELRQVTEAASEPAAEAAEPQKQIEEAETLETGPLAFDDEYLMADEPEDVLTVDTEAAPVEDDTPVETVAEKLRRIRAVVSKSIEQEEPQVPASVAETEPKNADEDSEESQIRSRALSETIASITADLEEDFEDEDDAAQSDSTEDNSELDSDSIANVISDEDDAEIDQQADAAENAFEAIAEEADSLEAKNVPEAQEEYIETALIDAEEDMASDSIESSFDEDDAIVASVGKIVASDSDSDEKEIDALGEAAAVTDDNQAEASVSEETDDAGQADDDAQRVRSSSPLSPIEDDGSDNDVGRLLEETDQKLNDDEGIRRRRVISQMRAAVAATKADRVFTKIITRESSDAEEQSPYRRDLDSAISRRPSVGIPDKIANESKPSPLVLVSSQRVDTVEIEPAEADVQPKRVEATSGDPSESASFREFATKMGATDLPDLLEAAAAYSAFVEGAPHFSRPEIMKRVARVDPALQLSRETGLRTFGQLLRQGKIQKLQRGQFTIGEETKFDPAQRIAGE